MKTKFFIKYYFLSISIKKKFKYKRQAKNPTAETQGNFVDKTTYKTEILNDENVNIGKSKNLGTKNMYDISKPLLRLDDLKKETATHAL